MPLFIMLSGYFAKRVSIKKVINFLLLLAIFQPLYRGFIVLINDEKIFKLSFDLPFYHLWFLFASVIWYLIAMGINKLSLKKIHKVLIIILFFAIGIAARFIADPFEDYIHSYGIRFKGTSFSYMRILVYLPYFFIGYFISKERMVKLYNTLNGRKPVKFILLIGMFIFIAFLNTDNAEMVFKGKAGIAPMEGSLLYRITYILIGYIIALIMCFIILNLVSDKKSIITRIGDRTLPIYLFHVFIVNLIKKVSILDTLHPFVLLPVLFVLAILITLLLENDIFVKYTYYLWNPLELIRTVKDSVMKLVKKS
jgi:fucose 4-O-acetylase-like acetyltransferase